MHYTVTVGKTECPISNTVDMHICVKQKKPTVDYRAQIQMKTVFIKIEKQHVELQFKCNKCNLFPVKWLTIAHINISLEK